MAKKFSKKDIDNLVEEIKTLLEKEELATDVYIYWNGKRTHIEYDWDDKNCDLVYNGWTVEENICPIDYFTYAARKHIVSMSFEGPLYHLYYDNFEYPAMDNILKKYGLYSEFGHQWNWSAFPNGDIEDYEYMDYTDRSPWYE